MAGFPKKMKLTKIEAIRLHRQMWRWLAKNPGKRKLDWPGFSSNFGDFYLKNGKLIHIVNNCFLCTYALDKVLIAGLNKHMCAFCPLDWGITKSINHLCESTIFGSWRLAFGNDKRRTELALQISHLKAKPVVKSKGSVWLNKKKE